MTVDKFCEIVLGIRPNNLMGFNGAAAGIAGSANSASDVVQQLQRSTVKFASAYKGNDVETVHAARRDVTAKIMVAVTVDAISENQADELIEALSQIMKERKQ